MDVVNERNKDLADRMNALLDEQDMDDVIPLLTMFLVMSAFFAEVDRDQIRIYFNTMLDEVYDAGDTSGFQVH